MRFNNADEWLDASQYAASLHSGWFLLAVLYLHPELSSPPLSCKDVSILTAATHKFIGKWPFTNVWQWIASPKTQDNKGQRLFPALSVVAPHPRDRWEQVPSSRCPKAAL